MSVLVVGSVALDTVETPFGRVENALGGSATYFSLAASLYTSVRLVGVVGKDFPQAHVELLDARGVDTAGLQVADGETFRWNGYYDYDLNVAHTLDTRLNVFADFRPQLPAGYAETEFVFLANIDPEIQAGVVQQTKQPKLTVLDSMNFWITGKPKELEHAISKVNIVLMNDAEIRQFANESSLVKAARRILGLGPRAVIAKKGEHGAALFTNGSYFVAPAYPLEDVRDPTGAGDTFAGGFVGYLAKTRDLSDANLRRAIIHGSVVASFCVEDFSVTRLASLTVAEVEARFREFQSFMRLETASPQVV